MIWYIVPAVISFLFKLIILWYSSKLNNNKFNLFIGLVAMSAIHNLNEIITYTSFLMGFSPEYLFRVYYVITCGLLGFMSIYAIDVSQISQLKIIKKPIAITCLIVGAIILTSDQIVSGYTAINYSITAIRAPNYWLFQIAAISMLLITLFALITGYLKAKDHYVQIRCLYIFMAILPLLLVGFGVIILMNLGYKVNAMMAVPIATSLFVFIAFKSEIKHKLSDLRRLLPYSHERVASHHIQQVLSDYAMENKTHKDAINEIEKVMVTYKNAKTNHNVSKTADSMSMPRSTLYAIYKRLDISR